MAKQKKAEPLIDIHTFPSTLMRGGIIAYVFLMFGLFPLFYQDKYYDMGDAKFLFYKNVTGALLIYLAVTGCAYLVVNIRRIPWKTFYKALSVTDWFVIAYAVSLFISYAVSPYKHDALYGYVGWNMGLLAQLSFVALYFFVSRCYRWLDDFLILALAVASIVFLLGVLHRFLIDPLALYQGLDPYYYPTFISTLGQTSWFSSYMCILLPLGMTLYWSCDKKKLLPWLGSFVALGAASWCTQNSDSAFLAVPAVLFLLFCFSFQDNRRMLRLLEILIISLSVMRVIGILQTIFSDHIVMLDTISMYMNQGAALWPVLILLVLLYALMRRLDNKGRLNLAPFRVLRIVGGIAIVAGLLLVIFLIYLTTNKMLPDFLAPLYNIGYFNFDFYWGNGRGFNWSYALSSFKEYSLVHKLFGIGPDCFAAYAYDLHADYLFQKWGNLILANAHNEWMNMLNTLGITGFIVYCGLFLSSLIFFLKKAAGNMIYVCFAACIVGYMVHNIFCYQQVICTPLIFILLGMGRLKELPPLWED